MNDAFIAAVAGGLRRYHEKHGIAVGDLIVTMPISIRTPTDSVGGNRATLMRFDVPAGVADPAHRIRLIHERTSKQRNENSLAYTQLIAGALNLSLAGTSVQRCATSISSPAMSPAFRCRFSLRVPPYGCSTRFLPPLARV